ncbi:MAG: hypothetical protein Q4D29_01475 [Lachnospiraceae bacterium]|nr:hypothetical protein [Lachnospiraceae bacterium]
MNKIVYLQANEKIATSFQEEFLKHEIEMLVVKTGEEALNIIAREKVLLLLLDINIPDMRFRKLVDRIRAISPQVIINVCVDVLDPLMITKLSNRHHVHKIYVAPWDIDSIVEEVKESIEVAIINEQVNVREEKINSEIKDLEATIDSLKNTLKKQQHSYTKLTELTDCFVKSVMDDENFNLERNERVAFASDVYTSILRMQTTGTFNIDKFVDTIKRDLAEIKGIAPTMEIGQIESCIFEGQSRSLAQNIRFCIFMIARLYGQFYDGFKISVTSHFITTKDAEFDVIIENAQNMNFGDENKWNEYFSYARELIIGMSSDFSDRKDENKAVYVMILPVAKD